MKHLLLFLAIVSAAAQAQQRPLYQTTKVEGTDGVYVFRNGNHQAMFVVTRDGVIATDPVAKQLQDAILNNFDFDYLYDFVFNPEKVKGRPYKPRRSPTASEPTVTAEASEAMKAAVTSRVFLASSFGSCPSVIACMSTTQ